MSCEEDVTPSMSTEEEKKLEMVIHAISTEEEKKEEEMAPHNTTEEVTIDEKVSESIIFLLLKFSVGMPVFFFLEEDSLQLCGKTFVCQMTHTF